MDANTLKGKDAESFLHNLAHSTFLQDWCYPNAMLGPGKEVDLLVVFDDTVIIWQAKNLKLHKDSKYSSKEVEKNLKQLSGAYRRLFELTAPIKLSNSRRGEELFDPRSIQHVYLISALLGEEEDYTSLSAEVRGKYVHVFSREFTSIVLRELDTIKDFTQYLADKEAALTAHNRPELTIDGGEEQLLGYYILNNREFSILQEGASCILLDGSHWSHLTGQAKYIEKKKADRISYGWDDIINRVHTTNSPDYEPIARELARLSRFERRMASQMIVDAWLKAETSPGNVFRRTIKLNYFLLCLLFAEESIEPSQRLPMLDAQCFVARGRSTDPAITKVIGIATEKRMGDTCSYSFLYLDLPTWGAEQQEEADRLQAKLGRIYERTAKMVHFTEYGGDDEA